MSLQKMPTDFSKETSLLATMKSYTHALSRHFRTMDSSSSTLVSSKADSSGPRRATVDMWSWKETVQDQGQLQSAWCIWSRHVMNPAGGQRLSAATCPQHQVLCSLAVLISEVATRHTGLTKVLGPLKLHLFNWRPEGPIQYFNNLVFNCENYNRAR